MKALDLTNLIFGRLHAIKRQPNAGLRTRWLCKCICGNQVIVDTASLRNGETKSCGCLQKDLLVDNNKLRIKHGLARHRLYGVWRTMLDRCNNSKNKNYIHYGGRGIYVCSRWYDVQAFYSDMSESYEPGLTLERKDVNGPYSPENCRWATTLEQGQNKRNTAFVVFQGEKITLAEFRRRTGYELRKMKGSRKTFKIDILSADQLEQNTN
jgi:hypothetical protein